MIDIFFATALMLSATIQDTRNTADRSWDTYVYGGHVIDLRLGTERLGSSNYGVIDCSTETMNCYQGLAVNIAVPKVCPDWLVGQKFSINGVTTDVLAIYERGEHNDKIPYNQYVTRLYLLGNPEKRSAVYVYNGTIQGFYWDWLNGADLYSVAKAGGIPALDEVAARIYRPLDTFVGMARCTLPRPVAGDMPN